MVMVERTKENGTILVSEGPVTVDLCGPGPFELTERDWLLVQAKAPDEFREMVEGTEERDDAQDQGQTDDDDA